MGEIDSIYVLVAPLGLSFSVFRAVDTIIECYLGVIDRPGILDVMAYGLFAPVQIVGPIMQFREMELVKSGARLDMARWGALQIAIGLAKVFILAWPLSWSNQIATLFHSQNLWVDWLSILILPLFLFLNFSGFSDMSIGVAAVFGYRLAPNFNKPLLRPSLQQFWANWHMSLTRFAQRNVYMPIVGVHKQRQYFGILCTMMVIALWHNLSIALVLFGALHGGALVLERVWQARAPRAGLDIAPGWGHYVRHWAMMYIFLALTVPLLLLRDADILRFYAELVGVR
jgi:D-alanyl-lipoteichoic acid acyltransferase DltB (MBOAT superfamily)